MKKDFIDFDTNKYCVGLSENIAIDEDGEMLMRTGENTAIDIKTGEMHIVYPSPYEEDKEST